MKYLIVCFAVIAAVVARPQEGAQFTNDAINQAKSQNLIPAGATIERVNPAVALGAYENIPGNQRINLFEILGDTVPSEVVNNLQSQIDQIGNSR